MKFFSKLLLAWDHVKRESTAPNLGASRAIAGVMGAFLITYPREQIRTLVLFGWFARITFIPAALLHWTLVRTPALQRGRAVTAVQSGGIAYMAHVGGFIFGAVTARPFERSLRGAESEA